MAFICPAPHSSPKQPAHGGPGHAENSPRFSPRRCALRMRLSKLAPAHSSASGPWRTRSTFSGMLNWETLERAFVDGRKEQPLTNLVETAHVPHVHTDHALHLALERMSKYHLDVLPVVHRADIHKLEGVVTLTGCAGFLWRQQHGFRAVMTQAGRRSPMGCRRLRCGSRLRLWLDSNSRSYFQSQRLRDRI